MKYLWNENVNIQRFPALEKNAAADVLIVGGGMAGILCALILKERGIPCLLVEGQRIGEKITKGTTAVLTAQHDTLYSDLVSNAGAVKAKQYLDANLAAVEDFRKLAQEVLCDFENKPSVIYSRTDAEKMRKEAKTLQDLGFPAEFGKEIELPVRIAGCVRFPNQGQFHPLKFIAGVAPALNIFEDTFVRDIEEGKAFTDRGVIRAKKIIVATHFPFIDRHGLFFAKMYQQRSYVIALENAQDVGGTYVDYAENGLYFRNYNNLLLIGGGDHRTGKKGGAYKPLRDFAKKHYPNATEKYAWATQDCMSLDGVPYIGQYSSGFKNVYTLTGFNEWGMTTSMLGAKILADMVEGKQNPYAEVFAPNRSMAKMQLLTNLAETTLSFLTPSTKRCAHLGCALKWNPIEHTWDCPCHGSRFDEHGVLIDNPANKNSNV
ncbi:Cytochrome b6-f complex iron-sulfur subunit [bioreactor metagenome]|uniref:Cytochrome b6-f complex iron-sulfur subunit n=1 Tax=bioreactor metagenome TaxID=1076179 RepID=A0A645ALI0_9ZZZZ